MLGWAHRLSRKREKDASTQEKNDFYFHKLTPCKTVDISAYKEAIDFVLKENDIRNVAISGSYGSGKSSVLETYKQNCQKKFLHISLADFKPHNLADVSDSDKTAESVLEGKILNQLIHQISPDSIPQTGFCIKSKVTQGRIWINTIWVITLIGLVLYQFFFAKWKGLVSALEWKRMVLLLEWTATNIARLFFLLAGVVLFAPAVRCAIRKQLTTGLLKKISLQGNEIEIGRENTDSFFDKYLSEVLYLFENAGVDVIVFEDLDRHESSGIFRRLREINTLVNQKRPQKVLRFFYLLRDDIFSTKDRTKFFDCIIPVVPILDGSNAYDKFLEMFRQGGIQDLFSPQFLQGLSLYIDEMRLLKNVINEFQIYDKRLNSTELNHDKMLALITYKNIFPKDFTELQLNRGFVHELFELKPALTKTKREQIEKEIAGLEQQLEQAGKAFLTDAEIERLTNYARGYSAYELVKRLATLKEFDTAKTKSEQEATSEKISKLKNDLTSLTYTHLKDLLSRENIDQLFYEAKYTDGNKTETRFEEIKGNHYFDLLKFLLRNGYIDESYSDYMTYFYPESISKNDKTFLRSIADKKAKDWNHLLDNPAKVFDWLSQTDFAQLEVLNFQLFTYLLRCVEDDRPVQKLLLLLQADKNTAFINAYLPTISSSDVVRLLARRLNASWTDFFTLSLGDTTFLPHNRVLWAKATLCASPDEIIKAVNKDDCLRTFIANTPGFLVNTPIEDNVKLIQGMQLLSIEMKSITVENVDADLLKAVYEKDLYELNADNIVLMLKVFYDEKVAEKLWRQNYSIIMRHPASPLAKRINAHIDGYLDIVLQKCESIIEDTQKHTIGILNHETTSYEHKRQYIHFLRTRVLDHLQDIKDTTLWATLLYCQKVVCSPANIICYFKDNSLDGMLTAFINDGLTQEVDFSIKALFENEEQERVFFESIVSCMDIENGRYERILSTINQDYPEFTRTGIKDDKVAILVKRKKIGMSVKSLDHIRKNYPSVLIDFITLNIDEYRTLMSNHFDDADVPCLVENYGEFSPAIQEQVATLLSKHPNCLIGKEIALPLSLLDCLIQNENVSVEVKIKLFSNSLPNIVTSPLCLAYLTKLGLKEFEKLFNTGRPKIQNTEDNERILAYFKKSGWIKDYEADAENSNLLKVKKCDKKDVISS